MDPAGSGVGAFSKDPPPGLERGVRSGAGPHLLQFDPQAPGGAHPAFRGESRRGAFDGAAAGCLFSLGTYGGLLCGGVCPESQRVPSVSGEAEKSSNTLQEKHMLGLFFSLRKCKFC